MSGAIEVVGLVLAAFPIVITLLERYQDGYDGLRDWVFFRREFAHLLNELSREQIIFRQQVESMLRTITESEFVVKEMLDDAKCKGGEDAGLARKLMGKLCVSLWRCGSGLRLSLVTSIESCDFWSSHCDDSGSVKEFTHLTAALEWQKAAIDEGGITLHQVTSRCIRGNFGITSVNLNEGECMKAVYDQVVRPLENLLKDVWLSRGM